MLRNQKPETRNQYNLTNLLRQRLSSRIFRIIRKIGNIAEDNGISAYIVGGFVRDLLLGRKNLDIDIAVEADACAFTKVLKEKMGVEIVTHPRFGTAAAALPGGFKVDIASARREDYVHPAVLPEVHFSSIREDLLRRDFTINALAVKINRQDFGRLEDSFDGQSDLAARKIRTLHDRSFIDDPTRIFRAVRFEQRFAFRIERHTEQLIREAAALGIPEKLSRFRVGHELMLFLKENDPLRCLLRLGELCRIQLIHPALKLDQRAATHFNCAQANIAWRRRSYPKEAIDGWLVYFLILTCGLPVGEVQKLGRDFSFTRANLQKLAFFQQHRTTALKAIGQKEALLPHQVYQVLRPFSVEGTLALLCLAKNKKAKQRLRLFLGKLAQIKLRLGGEDLQKLKLKPGPRYQEILQSVLYARIDGKLKTKANELKYAKGLAGKLRP